MFDSNTPISNYSFHWPRHEWLRPTGSERFARPAALSRSGETSMLLPKVPPHRNLPPPKPVQGCVLHVFSLNLRHLWQLWQSHASASFLSISVAFWYCCRATFTALQSNVLRCNVLWGDRETLDGKMENMKMLKYENMKMNVVFPCLSMCFQCFHESSCLSWLHVVHLNLEATKSWTKASAREAKAEARTLDHRWKFFTFPYFYISAV